MNAGMKRIVTATLTVALCAAVTWAATITVSKDGRGQYTSVQAAVNAAGPGDVVKILDAAVYEEQVNIDSTKSGLTLTSANPLSLNKPTIRWQDRANVGPRTCAEAQLEANVTFDRNGALRLLRVRNVVIDGVAVDGGGSYPFAYPGVWREGADCSSRTYPLFHGNAAIAVWISGDIQIRNCDIRNAYFGIMLKDRNEGGIFANANPADVAPWNVVPLSGFGKTGNHLVEHNRIHNNTWGMFFESTWDLGSNVRYNLFFENHHATDAEAARVKAMPDGEHQPGGALFFKDHVLSPLAIYNNTFWHNFLILAGHWRAGSQHLVFNNIYGAPHRFWGSDPSFQNPFHKLDQVFKYRMKNCVYAAQSQAPTQYHVAIMNDLQLAQTGGVIPQGTLITTPFPAAADIRWVETKFLSTDPASADFLAPDWNDTAVQKYIVDKGYPAAGITDPDGSPADLGAIPSGGGRIGDLVIVKPISPVMISGTMATMTFNVGVMSGRFTNPEIAYIRFIKNVAFQANPFGGSATPIPEADIMTVTVPAGTRIQPGSNTLNIVVPARLATEYYAFFEIILKGTGTSGAIVTSTVGFMPYRKMGYEFRVTVLDIAGTDTLTEVRAGESVKLKIDAVKADGTLFTNEIKPVDVSLNSGATLKDPNGARVTVSSIVMSATKVVVFTVVPSGGVEYVMVSGMWSEAGNSVAFYGASAGIRVLPGPPASMQFQDPPSNSITTGNPPVLDPGVNYRGSLQVFDRWGNKVDTAVSVALSSSRPDWADIVGPRTITTDTTGRGTFLVAVVNGPQDSIFTLNGRVDSAITDNANMKIGEPLDQLWIFYGDEGAFAPGTELRGQVGQRLEVTIWASIDGRVPIATRANAVDVRALASSPSLRFYTAETGGDTLSRVTLVNGAARVWVTSSTPVSDGGMQVYDNGDNTLVAGDKSTRSGIYFRPEVLIIDSAFYYARNGRGAVDSVDIFYRNALPYPPDSVVLNWPNKQTTARVLRAGDTRMVLSADSHRVTITLATPFPDAITSGNGPNGAGFGTSWNRAAVDAPAMQTPFYVDDRVGPMLRDTVWVNERFTAGNDTMTVTFSERIDSATFNGAAFLLVKPGVGTPVVLTVVGTAASANGWVRVTFSAADLGANGPEDGDSVRINAVGPIRDATRHVNPAHPQNTAVPVKVRRRPAPIVHSYYRDVDADGIVDSVVVNFARAVTADAISVIDVLFGGDTVAVLSNMLTTSGTTVRMSIEGLLGTQARNVTGGPMRLSVTYRDFLELYSDTASDSAAPVITAATYAPAALNSGAPDTLTVRWSESVTIAGNATPLLFRNSGVGQYTMALEASGARSDTFIVRGIDSLLSYPGSGDSVWINVVARVADGASEQDNPANRRVALTVKPKPYELDMTTKVGPNPFNPSRDRITINGTSYGGTVIAVNPGADLSQVDGDVSLRGTVSIYDAVGTLVASYRGSAGGNVELVRPDQTGTIYFVWNGRNHQDRLVGSGTYVALVSVKVSTGEEQSFRKPIGVIR